MELTRSPLAVKNPADNPHKNRSGFTWCINSLSAKIYLMYNYLQL